MSQTPDEVTTRTFHWVVQRPDGIGFATTSHDRPLLDGATIFEADADLRPSEMLLSDEMFGSSLELQGSLSTSALTHADIVAGRWSGASLQFTTGDWARGAGTMLLCEGELGRMRLDEGCLSVSVDLLPRAASLPACVETSPECRAILGDQLCRVDLRSRRRRAKVVGVDADAIVVDRDENSDFAMGRLRWLSGERCGLSQVIVAVDGPRLILQALSEASARVGDQVVLTEGCDGRRATCADRFSNILNFRGEPDLPGTEVLMRFPGA